MSRSGVVNTEQLLFTQLFDGAVDKFPKTFIYDSDGVLITTRNLNHVAGGFYRNVFTPLVLEQFAIITFVFSDAARTIEDRRYNREGNTLVIRNEDVTFRANFSTTIVNATDTQEVLCWLEASGQTLITTSNARVIVSDGVDEIWSASAAAPDSRGVFKISKADISQIISSGDKNFAATVTIEFESKDFTTTLPFYTVG